MGTTKILQQTEFIGPYTLLRKIASGGMADVWLAHSKTFEGFRKLVAIKKMKPELVADQEFVRMFRDEALIALNLSHSNIVSILDFGQSDDQLYLVMEYVRGQNLDQIVNRLYEDRQKLGAADAAYIIGEVAKGLAHAHNSKDQKTGQPLYIVHRDISPQNLMLTSAGEVKILDFGIARTAYSSRHTQAGLIRGKPGYFSPEQVDGAELDARTDIFSLGICLWEMLAGDRLFKAKSHLEAMAKVKAGVIPSLSSKREGVPEELEKIVRKCLEIDREKRYQTADELQRDLSRFLNKHEPDFSPVELSARIRLAFGSDELDTHEELAPEPLDPTVVSMPSILDLDSIRRATEQKIEVAALPVRKVWSMPLYPETPEGNRFPKKLAFLFGLFIFSLFVLAIKQPQAVVRAMPESLKPRFVRIIDPLADDPEVVGKPVAAVNPVAIPASPAQVKYVTIDGQSYIYNPDGIYIINGNKVYIRQRK